VPDDRSIRRVEFATLFAEPVLTRSP